MKVYFILTKMSSRSGVVFSPTQASQGLVGRTDFNSGVLETSEKLECVGGGGGEGEGRVLGKSASLPSSPLSLMINSNILKKGALATGDKEERPDNDDDDDDTSRYGHNDHAEDYNYDCLCDEDYDRVVFVWVS